MKIIILSVLALVAIAVLAPLVVGGNAFAQSDEIKQGACLSGGGTWNKGNNSCSKNGSTVNAEMTVNNTVATVINVFSWAVGVLSVIMVMYGGFLYVTSGGTPEKTKNGKNAIIFALIGMVIVALAQIIVFFVLDVIS